MSSEEAMIHAAEAVAQVDGFVYPNEVNMIWSVLIVVYPYVTGLVAGAFILASMVRVFNLKVLEPAYRLALLTSLAFLLAAPLPLLFHLGQPQRCLQIMMTPHLSSPMAIFGFVYAWYLMAVLLLELWFDYRRDFVLWSRVTKGFKKLVYLTFTVGVTDLSVHSLRLDRRMGKIITIVGSPSAFILHGYVGFIFGSIKANPWWGNVLMPIIFIFSAMVSGIALCIILYLVLNWTRRTRPDMPCLDTMAKILFYTLVTDATIEALDWIHRFYEAEESFHILKALALGKLFSSMLILQALLGTAVPLVLLGIIQLFEGNIGRTARRWIYGTTSILILVGVLAMRWNVVIGGQLFSKSLRGFTTYKMELATSEGLLVSIALLVLPFVILTVFIKLFLPASPPGAATAA
jgi:Ni/Fe-hydrogenase subunit HybB-like protein